MHLTLKEGNHPACGCESAPATSEVRRLLREFNHERPHEALGMKCPAEVYTASTTPYRGIGEPQYSFHDKTVVVFTTRLSSSPIAVAFASIAKKST
jgi:hypothetical protein